VPDSENVQLTYSLFSNFTKTVLNKETAVKFSDVDGKEYTVYLVPLDIDGNCGNLAFLLYLLFSDNDSHFIITLEKDDYCVNEEYNIVDEFKNLENMFYLSRMAGFHHVTFSTGKTLYDINGSFNNEREALKEMAQGDRTFNNHNFNSIFFKPEETMTPINVLTAVTCGTMQTIKIEEIIDGIFIIFNK
jgi:hypothetical protein